jgi:hypothetical protein
MWCHVEKAWSQVGAMVASGMPALCNIGPWWQQVGPVWCQVCCQVCKCRSGPALYHVVPWLCHVWSECWMLCQCGVGWCHCHVKLCQCRFRLRLWGQCDVRWGMVSGGAIVMSGVWSGGPATCQSGPAWCHVAPWLCQVLPEWWQDPGTTRPSQAPLDSTLASHDTTLAPLDTALAPPNTMLAPANTKLDTPDMLAPLDTTLAGPHTMPSRPHHTGPPDTTLAPPPPPPWPSQPNTHSA